MTSHSIRLSPDARADRVLDLVRSVVEARGYLWEPSGLGGVAHQGGKPTTGESSMRLALGVTIDGDGLSLEQRSSGHVSAALGLGPLGPSKVRRELDAVVGAVGDALDASGLTA